MDIMDSAINGTISGRIREEIVDVILKSQNPLSTQDICLKLERSWHSVQTNCLRLQVEGRLHGFRAGRVNLWQMAR
jgi:hypothetical protein